MDASTRSMVIGFILTTVLGGLLGAALQRAQWSRQARLEIAKQGFADAASLLDDIYTLIDKRYYHLYRWFVVVRDNAAPATLDERASTYFTEVNVWNEKLRMYHQGLRRHLGISHALSFLNYRDDLTPEKPTSLHYRFVLCTNLVRRLETEPEVAALTWSEIEKLNWHLTEFAQETTTALMKASQSLRHLRAEDWSKEAPSSLTSRPEPHHPSNFPH
jgi:hypothetical protein